MKLYMLHVESTVVNTNEHKEVGSNGRIAWVGLSEPKSANLCIGVMIYAHEPHPTPVVRPLWLGWPPARPFMRAGR